MKHVLRYLPLGDLVAQKAWKQLGWMGGVVLLFMILPLILGFDHRVISNVVLFVAIYAVLALGLNVVVGYTGLLDLGYVTFLATGAVVTFIFLQVTSTPTGWALPMGTTEDLTGGHPFVFTGSHLLLIFFAGLVCAGLGVLRGIPTLRLTGDYYAIVTLGLAEIGYLVYLNSWWTGGAHGMSLKSDMRPTMFGSKLYADEWWFYYLVLIILGLTIVFMDRLNRSRTGRAWAAIRLDEVAARACGIDVDYYKMVAFAISGFFGGVGGALYALWVGLVAAKSLDVWQSILILCAVVLGGMGSIRGVLLGSAILFPLREVLREEIFGVRVPPEASYLVYGLLLIIVMRFRPQGLLPRGTSESMAMTPEEEAELRASSPRLFVLRETGDDAAQS